MMDKVLGLAVILSLVAVDETALARNPHGIKLNPGERLVAVDGVPVNGHRSQRVVTRQPARRVASEGKVRHTVKKTTEKVVDRDSEQGEGRIGHAVNIVGDLVRSNRPFSHTPGSTALEKANAERARNRQAPLKPDPELQKLALKKATIAAERSYKNHIGGSLGGADCEGVGHTNGRFLTCCLDEPGTYGGAAMVQGRDGWYCCLLVR